MLEHCSVPKMSSKTLSDFVFFSVSFIFCSLKLRNCNIIEKKGNLAITKPVSPAKHAGLLVKVIIGPDDRLFVVS